jgi:hypothetical protein
MRLRIETGLTIIVMAIIFTLACTGECSPSQFNEMRAYKSTIHGAYVKVGLGVKFNNHEWDYPMSYMRFIP